MWCVLRRAGAVRKLGLSTVVLLFPQQLGRIRGERDRAAHESRLIMSERDSVLKEIELLQDKVDELSRRSDALEKDKKSALDEAETLRREIASALQDRDHALKQINDLKDAPALDNDSDNRLGADHNFNRRDRLSGTERDRNREEKAKRESSELSDEVNKEHEALKKEVERVKAELQGECDAFSSTAFLWALLQRPHHLLFFFQRIETNPGERGYE